MYTSTQRCGPFFAACSRLLPPHSFRPGRLYLTGFDLTPTYKSLGPNRMVSTCTQIGCFSKLLGIYTHCVDSLPGLAGGCRGQVFAGETGLKGAENFPSGEFKTGSWIPRENPSSQQYFIEWFPRSPGVNERIPMCNSYFGWIRR